MQEISFSYQDFIQDPIKFVMELFKTSLEDPIKNCAEYSHISIDKSLLSKSGEIPANWLQQYQVQNWCDFVFRCQHCQLEIKSLNKLIKHMLEKANSKTKVLCFEPGCRKSFCKMNALINHVVKTHYQCLAYW